MILGSTAPNSGPNNIYDPTVIQAAGLPHAPTVGAKLDANTAQIILRAAGGNRELAKQLAERAGWDHSI